MRGVTTHRRPSLLLSTVFAWACHAEGESDRDEESAGDEESSGDVSFRTAGCDVTLIELVWTEPPPPVAAVGGASVMGRGELRYDGAATGSCIMGSFQVTPEFQPELNIIDGATELDGTLDPGEVVPFSITIKVKNDADASSVNPSNSFRVRNVDGEVVVSLPAEICAIPDSEISIKVIDDAPADGFVDGTNGAIPIPPNIDGFGSGIQGGVFPFVGLPRPFAANFQNREVTERQLVPPTGDCGWNGITGISGAAGRVTGVKEHYGPDFVGFFAPTVASLLEFRLAGAGCESTVQQTMAMSCPDGNYYDYETHPMTVGVDRACDGSVHAGDLSVTRDGECANRTWTPDADGDGIVDALAGGSDFDADGVPNATEDRDGDGDPMNDDTDADGIPDVVDWDDDEDAMTSYEEIAKTGGFASDIDGDGIPNYVDADDDGDGIPTAGEDADNNGQPSSDDADGDLIPDAYESGSADLDGDGIADDQDLDNDGDGVSNAGEDLNDAAPGHTPLDDDTDADGQQNYRDDDDDGDGIPSAAEDANANGNPADDDADGDLRPNYLDADS